MGRLLVLAVALLAVAGAAPAVTTSPAQLAYSRSDVMAAVDDGTSFAATLYRPDGTPPPNGWPAIVMLHGLGGKRADMNALAEQTFARDFVVLTYDLRGHGGTGGRYDVHGPRMAADLRFFVDWLGRRDDVDEARIGAWGISAGGGDVWHGLVAGVPLAAAVTVQSWVDLYDALLPQNLAKTGVIFGFLNLLPPDRVDPAAVALKDAAFAGRDFAAIRAFATPRSARRALARIRTPMLVFQGRRDVAFDLDQGLAAFRGLAGPKRLYIGHFGHGLARFPGPDADRVMTRSREWFDRFLRGVANGVDTGPAVELAPEPWRGEAVPYRTLPPTRRLTFALPGRATIGERGAVVRATRPTRSVLETFGAPTLTVRATARRGWPRLVAVLEADAGDRKIMVATGGVPTRPGTRTYTIRLLSQVTAIPARSRLRVFLANASTAQHPNNLVYLPLAMPAGARLTVGAARLTLPVLRQPVSRP